MKYWYLFYTCSILSGCLESKTTSTNASGNYEYHNGEINFLKVTDQITEQDSIILLNEDGSVWYRFSFFYDDSDGVFDFHNPDFRPFMFHPDYFVLLLQIVETDSEFKYVMVNHDNESIKKIRKSNILEVVSLNEVFSKGKSVNFTMSETLLFDSPNGKNVICELSDNYKFQVDSLSGNWIRIEYLDFAKGDTSKFWAKLVEDDSILGIKPSF